MNGFGMLVLVAGCGGLAGGALACDMQEIIGMPIVDQVQSGPLTAHFAGESPGEEFPARYGARELWFSFGDCDSPRPFQPAGTLAFDDWMFPVFSPDGGFVLLPQDRYGPYHVVARADLHAYLAGRAEPVAQLAAPLDGKAVHERATWISERTGIFAAACCGDVLIYGFAFGADADSTMVVTDAEEILRTALRGAFRVEQVRPASDTPSTLALQQRADGYLGVAARFGEDIVWPDKPICASWKAQPTAEPAPEDVSLEDLLPRAGPGGVWANLVCDGQTTSEIFVLNDHAFLSRTPNGIAWLIWRRIEEQQK